MEPFAYHMDELSGEGMSLRGPADVRESGDFYDARPRTAEVLVQGDRFTIVRRRETDEDLVAGETTV